MHSILIELITLSMAAVVFVPLFRKFGLGSILAYLASGIIIGPSVLGLISDAQEVLHFSELGIVLLLFVIGLELAPHKLWDLRRSIFGLGLLQVVLTGGLLTGVGILLGFPLALSYIAGFALALSSTAFSLQILEDNNQLATSHGRDIFSVLLFQDLAVVPMVSSLAFFLPTSQAPNPMAILKGLLIILALVLVGHYLIRHALRLIVSVDTPEIFTATALLIVLGTGLLLESVGLSMATGAFLAGVLLANSEYRHELEVTLAPFKGLLLGLFFMAVGMSLDLVVLSKQPQWVFLLTLSFMTIKALVLYVLSRVLRREHETSKNISINLALGGEFAFVLFSTALSQGLLDANSASLLNASVTLSMAITPFLFTLNQKYLRRFSEISERPYDEISPSNVEVIVAGFGRFGQIVMRFLNAENVTYTILEHDAAQVETARRFGNKVYYGDASRKDILEAAGAKKAKYLVLAIDDPDSSIATAKVAREHFPQLDIIARARNRQHAIDLMELGVTSIHRETYMTSLEVAKEVMLKRGRPEASVNKAIERFRAYDEKLLKKQYELRGDENEFRSYTTKAVKDLESILMQDQESKES